MSDAASGPVLHRLLANNYHATRALLETCRGLSREQFHQGFDIGLGNLHDTLRHVIGAMCRWADRIDERDLRPAFDEGDDRTADELLVALDEAHADLTDVAERVVAEGRLEEDFEVPIRGYERPFTFTRNAALVHVLTHGVHHRAQALFILRHLGVADAPEIDALESELAERPGCDPR